MRYKAIKRNCTNQRAARVAQFATLADALELFYREYWQWKVIDTVTGAEWHPY